MVDAFNPSRKKPRVLVVEDDLLLLAAIQDTLELDGYQVCATENGALALSALHDFCPQLIIADLVMPEIGGFELYYRVRGQPCGAAIPFIFISANRMAEAVEGLASNNCTYLGKPFGFEELLTTVQHCLE